MESTTTAIVNGPPRPFDSCVSRDSFVSRDSVLVGGAEKSTDAIIYPAHIDDTSSEGTDLPILAVNVETPVLLPISAVKWLNKNDVPHSLGVDL